MLRSIAAVALIAMVPLVQARTNSTAQIDCNGANVCGLVVIETGLGQGCVNGKKTQIPLFPCHE